MLNAIFEYKESKIIIQCSAQNKVKDICSKYSTKSGIKLESVIFISDNKILNLEETLIDQTMITEVNTEIIIKVYDNNLNIVEYDYQGRKSHVVVEKDEADLFTKISKKLKKPFKRLFFAFNGRYAQKGDEKKNFDQLSNKMNKADKSMNLVITDNELADDNEEGENQEKDEKKEEEEGKNERTNNLTEDNKNLNNNAEEENEPEKVYCINDIPQFFKSLYLVLIIQFILIAVFTIIGFTTDFYEKFTESRKAIWWTFSIITVVASFISGSCFDDDDIRVTKFTYFSLFLYIPIMSFYCFLMTTFIDEYKNIIGIIILFTLDAICIYIYNLLFKTYKGYGIFLLCVIVNVIATIILYYTLLSKPGKKTINAYIIISLIRILYHNIFNFESKTSFNDDEYIYAAMIFNYVIFFPSLVVIGLGLILAFLGIAAGLFVAFMAICLAFFFLAEIYSGLFR